MKRAAIIAALALAPCACAAPAPTPEASRAATTAASPGATRSAQAASPSPSAARAAIETKEYPVRAGTRPHDVAPQPVADGHVWFTAQATGELGSLDPATGESRYAKLGDRSAPHGVIVGPDGMGWVTDGGLNAIVRVHPKTLEVRVFPLPQGRPNVNLNTATFDRDGILWFTGQSGVYGRLDPRNGEIKVFDAPRGFGPYGIATTPSGDVYYASLAGSYVGKIDRATGGVTVLEPPTKGQGSRRVWSDSRGRIWVAEWNAGQLARYDPASQQWKEWRLPGDRPQAYAVFVDDQDVVWLSDWGASSLVRFDPTTEKFAAFPYPPNGNVRQILGRPGEVWAPLSGLDRLFLARTR